MAVTDLHDPVSSPAPVAADGDSAASDSAPDLPTLAPRSPLPLSRALALFIGLAVTSLLLLAAAAVSSTTDSPSATEPLSTLPPLSSAPLPSDAPEVASSPADDRSEADTPDTERTAASQIPALFPAEPSPVPQGLITDIEAASGEPLPVELGHLLSAIQEGFGRESVQLAPELRAYAFRMASRFDWNPDTFRVAVTAPDAELADARATTLRRLFESATGADRLQIRSGTGPHSLTLVSDS